MMPRRPAIRFFYVDVQPMLKVMMECGSGRGR
jgi:hypothetical protein